MPHVLAISGSLRADSHNTRLLRAAAALAPSGTALAVWTELKHVPPFDEDDETGPVHVSVARLRSAIRAADAVLIATPEYNGSIPGQLKNALDWASRPQATSALRGKAVAVIGASTGRFGAAWAQADTRRVLAALGAHVLADELPVATAHEAFTDTGTLRDPVLADRLAGLLATLVAARPASRTAA